MTKEYIYYSFTIEDLTEQEKEWWESQLEEYNFTEYGWHTNTTSLRLYSEGHADLDKLSTFVYIFIKQFRPNSFIGFEYSSSTDEEFGGGIVIVTNNLIEISSTYDFLQQRIKEINTQSEKQISSLIQEIIKRMSIGDLAEYVRDDLKRKITENEKLFWSNLQDLDLTIQELKNE